MVKTIFLDIATNPSSITGNTYSDAGSTGLTEVVLGNDIDNTASKATSVTYTCANDGTNTQVYLVYGVKWIGEVLLMVLIILGVCQVLGLDIYELIKGVI